MASKAAITTQKVIKTPGSKMAKSIKLCRITPKQAARRAAVVISAREVWGDFWPVVRSQKPIMNIITGITYNMSAT